MEKEWLQRYIKKRKNENRNAEIEGREKKKRWEGGREGGREGGIEGGEIEKYAI